MHEFAKKMYSLHSQLNTVLPPEQEFDITVANSTLSRKKQTKSIDASYLTTQTKKKGSVLMLAKQLRAACKCKITLQ